MAAKPSGLGSSVANGNRAYNTRPEWQWHRTPWWAVWRPAWRRLNPNTWSTTHSWEYQTTKQRARDFLKENFSDSSPTQAPASGTAINYTFQARK